MWQLAPHHVHKWSFLYFHVAQLLVSLSSNVIVYSLFGYKFVKIWTNSLITFSRHLFTFTGGWHANSWEWNSIPARLLLWMVNTDTGLQCSKLCVCSIAKFHQPYVTQSITQNGIFSSPSFFQEKFRWSFSWEGVACSSLVRFLHKSVKYGVALTCI